jgi:BMFP domain-containing protein YqiC
MAKKSVTMQELIGRKEELNKTSQLLSEKFQNLQNEISTTEKQIHMVNGALNVLDLLLSEETDKQSEETDNAS